MTKIIKSLLAVLLLVTLTGCTKATEKPNDPAPVSPPAANNVPEPEPDKSDKE